MQLSTLSKTHHNVPWAFLVPGEDFGASCYGKIPQKKSEKKKIIT